MKVNSTAPTPAPEPESWGHKLGHMATDIGLGVGAGIVADRIRRTAISKGSATTIAAVVGGTAVVKAVATGAVGVADNLSHGKDWSDGLGDNLLKGLRTGALDAGMVLVSGPIKDGIAKRFTTMGTVGQYATTGLVTGALGGAAYSGTDPLTWKHGVGAGLQQVGVSTAFGGAVGAGIGAVTGVVVQKYGPKPGAPAAADSSQGARGSPIPSFASVLSPAGSFIGSLAFRVETGFPAKAALKERSVKVSG